MNISSNSDDDEMVHFFQSAPNSSRSGDIPDSDEHMRNSSSGLPNAPDTDGLAMSGDQEVPV